MGQVLPPIPTSRCGSGCCVIEGVLYVAGGYRFPDGPSSLPALAAFERFDPARGSWERLPDMPTPRLMCRAVSASGSVYAIGGIGLTGALGVVERFSLADGAWSQLAPMTPRSSLQAFVCDGSIYAFGT